MQAKFVTWKVWDRERSTLPFNFNAPSALLLLRTYYFCSHSTEENLVTWPLPTASQTRRQSIIVFQKKEENDSVGRLEVSTTLLLYIRYTWECTMFHCRVWILSRGGNYHSALQNIVIWKSGPMFFQMFQIFWETKNLEFNVNSTSRCWQLFLKKIMHSLWVK